MTSGEDKAARLDAATIAWAIRDAGGSTARAAAALGVPAAPFRARYRALRIQVRGVYDNAAGRGRLLREQGEPVEQEQPIVVMTVENEADLADHVKTARNSMPAASAGITALTAWHADACEPVDIAWKNRAITVTAYLRALRDLNSLGTAADQDSREDTAPRAGKHEVYVYGGTDHDLTIACTCGEYLTYGSPRQLTPSQFQRIARNHTRT